MQVIVNGLLTNYSRSGKGKSVLLLHGWADNLHTFDVLVLGLSKDFDVIALDLPGFGGTDKPSSPWDLGDYSKFISDFLNKIQAREVYAVIGHSNGAALAIKAASEGLVKTNKLVLVSASGIRNNQQGRLTALKVVAKAGKAITRPLPSTAREKLRGKLYSSIGSDYLLAGSMGETFKKVVGEDLQPAATKLNLPTLLIYGGEDSDTPPAFGEVYHQLINGSTLEIISGGHFLLIDQPERVVKLVRDFLC